MTLLRLLLVTKRSWVNWTNDNGKRVVPLVWLRCSAAVSSAATCGLDVRGDQ
jgi:hypothetical protein